MTTSSTSAPRKPQSGSTGCAILSQMARRHPSRRACRKGGPGPTSQREASPEATWHTASPSAWLPALMRTFETFEELIEGAYRQTSRSELECCIEQVQRAALYLEASKRLSPNAEVERLALSPSLLAELDAIECTEQTDRLADLDDELASALVSAIGADEPLPNAMTVIQANRLMEARKAFGDFDASLNAAERQASNANDALKADMACRAKAMGSRKDNLGSHAHAASL